MSGIISDSTLLGYEQARQKAIQKNRNLGVSIDSDATLNEANKNFPERPLYYYCFGPTIPGYDNPGVFHSVDLWFWFETLGMCYASCFFSSLETLTFSFRETKINYLWLKPIISGSGVVGGGGNYDVFYNATIPNIVMENYTTHMGGGSLLGNANTTRFIAPKLNVGGSLATMFHNGNVYIQLFDIKNSTKPFSNNSSSTLSALNVLILRDTQNVTALNGAILPNIQEIYVPQTLLNTYKTASNWSVYADKFIALENSIYENEDWYKTEDWYEEMVAYFENLYGDLSRFDTVEENQGE